AEQFLAAENVFRSEEFVAFEGVLHGFMEDRNIGDVRIRLERVKSLAQTVEAGPQLLLVGLGHRHSRRRDQVQGLRLSQAGGEREKQQRGAFHLRISYRSGASVYVRNN